MVINKKIVLDEQVNQKDFYSKVYKLVESIPIGKVTTYGAIAGHLGVNLSSILNHA